jgi:protein TonB
MIADRAQAWVRTPERKSRLIYGVLITAVLLHVLWFSGLLFGQRLYGLLLRHPAHQAQTQSPPHYATIEMIMQNTKTAGGDHILKQPESNPGKPGKPKTAQQASKPAVQLPPSLAGILPASTPSPQADQTAPDGTSNNPGTGLVSGDFIIPASPDAKHPNVGPAYPPLAATMRQSGIVKLMIHVGANGLPTGVDITQSSGYPSLDEAARVKALGWHLRPATKDGHAVPSDFPFAVEFDAD